MVRLINGRDVLRYAGRLLLLLALVLLPGRNGWVTAADNNSTSPTLLTTWTFSGRVYEGNVGLEPPNAQPLQGVTVCVYGSNNTYPSAGTLLRCTTTDSSGWYGLSVYDDDGPWEYYHLRETDPPGYVSNGATSVSGIVRDANWIEYIIPLTGKTLTGNKFWDRRPATDTPIPTPTSTNTPPIQPTNSPTNTPTIRPTNTPTNTPPRFTPTPTATGAGQPVLSGRVYAGEVGDETQPLSGVLVNLHCSQNPDEPGTLLRSTTTNAEGWYGLNAGEICEFYNILELDPPGYLPVGATSVGGTVRDPNWIQYVYPLTGKVLTGNRFWDRLAGGAATATPTPTGTPPRPTGTPTRTFTPSPTPSGDIVWRTFSGQLFQVQFERSQPWPGIVVGLFKATISCEEGILVAQVATDALGRFTLEHAAPVRDEAIYYNVIVLDEGIKVFGAQSESGGYFTDQGWLQFVSPAAGNHAYNNLFAKGVINEKRLLPAADADAYVNRQTSDMNYGSLDVLRTGYSAGPDVSLNRAYLYFDLDYIPITATVTKATLNLYLERTGGLSKVCMSVHHVQSDWWETQHPWGFPAITWNNQPNFSQVPSATHYVDTVLGYKTWDVTALVQNWVNSPQNNRGLALLGPEAGSGWSRTFTSREGSHPPRLVIYLQSSVPFATPTPTNTPTLTPTPTPTGTPVTRQVQITAVEVTQAIQNLSNTVPLVAGKKTVVRVHLKVTDGKGDLAGISGYLYYPYTGYGPVFSSQNTMTARANPDRGQFSHTLNFVVDGQYATGSGLMFVRVFPPSGVTFPGIGELQDSRVISFGTVPAMNLRLVGVSYVTNTVTYSPRNIDYANVESWLRRAYPISTLNSSRTTTSVSYATNKPGPNCSDVNTKLAQMKVVDGASADTRYYGLVFQGPPTNYFMRGCCCNSGTASGPTGASTWGWDTDGSYGDWYAGHELGHSYGRKHVLCAGNEAGPDPYYPYPNGVIGGYGMDVENLTVYGPTWTDVMTYCDYEWVSNYTYEGIRNKMITPLAFSMTAAQPQERLLVVGTIDRQTDAVTLNPFLRVPNASQSVERAPGEYRIVLSGQGGARLAEYPFTPRVQEPGPPQESGCGDTSTAQDTDLPAAIFEFIPWHPETARISIYHGERELAGRNVSPNPPTVQVLSPNGGEVIEEGFFNVIWNARDVDGDPLTFSILYSTDNGETWMTLDTDIAGSSLGATEAGVTEASYRVDAHLLAGSPAALIRVLVSDGVNTTFGQSNAPFLVLRRSPQVTILSPTDGSFINADEVIALTGDAYDPEQGALTGSALTWESDRDGLLGSGTTLVLLASHLTPGPHRITLRASDSDDMTGGAGVNIVVGRRLYLPVTLRNYSGNW